MFVPYSEIANSSRIWVYQSDRSLSDKEVVFIKQKLLAFCNEWKAHQAHLKSSYKVLHNRFIILLVDEEQKNASGCSIDSSVKVIKEIEADFGIDLFNRTQIALEQEGEIFTLSIPEFKKVVKADTIVFNNLVSTKADLEENWKIVASNSWHAKFLT
tara:strand:- start:1934 stop:2404 length:471 start_codon:yes stop_codon:yes gene_type:complete